MLANSQATNQFGLFQQQQDALNLEGTRTFVQSVFPSSMMSGDASRTLEAPLRCYGDAAVGSGSPAATGYPSVSSGTANAPGVQALCGRQCQDSVSSGGSSVKSQRRRLFDEVRGRAAAFMAKHFGKKSPDASAVSSGAANSGDKRPESPQSVASGGLVSDADSNAPLVKSTGAQQEERSSTDYREAPRSNQAGGAVNVGRRTSHARCTS